MKSQTDTLARRLRFAKPNPVVSRLELTERDYLIFEAIDRHGALPANYLFALTKHVGRNYAWLQRRLTELYNGTTEGSYLHRPQQQFAGYEAHYQHVVYDLTPKAKAVLAERGTLSNHSPRRSDPFIHQLMSACVGASIELATPDLGLQYISRDEILSGPKCPQATKDLPNPMAIALPAFGEHKVLIPDDLFGLRGRDDKGDWFRFFAVEIDRNTESIERKTSGYNTFGSKIAGYLSILKAKSYRGHWGIPNLTVLTVTTNAVHAQNIIDYIKRQGEPTYGDRFAFQWESSFGANWRVPKELLSKLLNEPWTTASGLKDIGKP